MATTARKRKPPVIELPSRTSSTEMVDHAIIGYWRAKQGRDEQGCRAALQELSIEAGLAAVRLDPLFAAGLDRRQRVAIARTASRIN